MSALNLAWLRPQMYEKYSLLWFNKDLDIDREELTESLWKKYNEVPFPIQSLDAFHSDALAASREARDADEFHALMEEKRKQRLNEYGQCARDIDYMLKQAYPLVHISDSPVRALVNAASLETLFATITSSLGTGCTEALRDMTYRLRDESIANLQYLRDHPQPPRASSPPRASIPVPRGEDLKAWNERTPIRRTTEWMRDSRLRTVDDFCAGPTSSVITESRGTDTADLADWIHCLSRTTPEEEHSLRSKGTESTLPSKSKTVLGKRQTGNPKKVSTPQKMPKKTAEADPTPTRQTRSMKKRLTMSPIPTPITDNPERAKQPKRAYKRKKQIAAMKR